MCFLKHLVVPEPKYTKTLCCDLTVTMFIVTMTVHVLPAIELDDELRFKACEVGDIAADRNLAAEAIAGKLAPAQAPPKVILRVGRAFSQFASAPLCDGITHERDYAPSPTLPRADGAREEALLCVSSKQLSSGIPSLARSAGEG